MVDTALAADLLAWARLFTAEAWVKPHGGRTLLVRRRAASQYLRLDGLLKAMA